MTRSSAWLLAAAAAALIALAPAAAQTGKTQDLVFVVGNNLFSTPAFVASENGYWAERGLNVRIKQVASGREITQAINAGEAQMGASNLGTTTAVARSGGNLLKGVMVYYNDARYVAVAGGRGIIGRKDRGVVANDPRSLIGKKIGSLAGSTQEVYLREYLARGGVDIKQVQVVNVPVPDMPITLAQGLVDAAVPWEPYLAQSLRELGPNAVAVSRGAPGLVADAIGVVAKEQFIGQNADLIERFATALVEATQFIRKNPAEAAKIATYHLDGLNLADATEGLKQMAWDPRLSICTQEGLVETTNDMIRQNLIKAMPFKAGDLADPSFTQRISAAQPQFFADLPPLPATLADCKGGLGKQS